MKKVENNILAHGEVTGHYHQAVGKGVEVLEDKEKMFLSAPNGCEVIHQEHKPVNLLPGEYERVIVREYDPFQELARQVKD